MCVAVLSAKFVRDKNESVQKLRREANDNYLQMEQLRVERNREAKRFELMPATSIKSTILF